MLGPFDLLEERAQLLHRQDDRPLDRLFGMGDPLVVDVLLQGDLVEEAHDAVAEIDGGRGEILSLAQVQQIGTELPFRQLRGVPGLGEIQEPLAVVLIGDDALRAESTQRHVLQELLPGL